jgi:hypothetical protein
MYKYRFAVVGALYAVAYLLLALGAAGFGHGTYLTLIPIWPYGLGLLVYPLAAHLLVNLRTMSARATFVSILFAHYAIIGFHLFHKWSEEQPYLEKTWRVEPINLVLPLSWFLIGHAILWVCFLAYVFMNKPSKEVS